MLSRHKCCPCVLGRDSKQCVLLTEDVHGEMDHVEASLFRDEVARRYARFFHCTLHHNNGYFLQVRHKPISLGA